MVSVIKSAVTTGLLLCVLMRPGGEFPSRTSVTKVGDMAPPLSVDRWLKGDPVSKWQADHVYVVEFWATWCVPCMKVIPHLNHLHRQYKNDGLVVVGVASHEFKGLEGVQSFMDGKQGRAINYRIAWDGDGSMETTWQTGGKKDNLFIMPDAYVIDHRGKIVWAGNPLSDAKENALDRAVASAVKALKATSSSHSKKRTP